MRILQDLDICCHLTPPVMKSEHLEKLGHYHGCQYPGDARSQAISRCVIGYNNKHILVFHDELVQLRVPMFLGIKSARQGESYAWWRHQMETLSALLAICAGNSPVTGEFPAQMPVTRSFDVFFDLRLNKRLSKQWWGWWFETPSRSLWRHCNGMLVCIIHVFTWHVWTI